VDVIAGQAELVMTGAVGGVSGQLRGRQGEDRPAATRVDRWELEQSPRNARTASATVVKMIAWTPVIMILGPS
jgi:hypothetical protein